MPDPVLITQRILIRGVAERFRETYASDIRADNKDPMSLNGYQKDKVRIYKRLCKLDPETATPGDVATIIGNDSWTRIVCNGCDQAVTVAAKVGQAEDYESSTAVLCAECIHKADAMLKALEGKDV